MYYLVFKLVAQFLLIQMAKNDTGGYYKVKKIIPYAGSEDLAIVQVEEDSVYPKIKNSVKILKSLNLQWRSSKMIVYQSLVTLIHIKISIICLNQQERYYPSMVIK